MIKLGEVVMILDLHRQGLTVSAIARELGVDRKTVRKCIARGLEPPVYGPRKPRQRRIDPFVRVSARAGDGLSGPDRPPAAAGDVASADMRVATPPSLTCCATFVRPEPPVLRSASRRRRATKRRSTSPNSSCSSRTSRRSRASFGCSRSCLLGFSRLIWARFVLHQDMQTVLRCHMAAFEAIGGIPNEILYDRMKTAVIGEAGGSIVYNRALIDFARHYGFQPKACRPYRAKTKGKVERPYPLHP